MKPPDILKSYCIDLHFSGVVNLSTPVIDTLKKECKEFEKGVFCIKRVKPSENEYTITLMLTESKKTEGEIGKYDLMIDVSTKNFFDVIDLKEEGDIEKVMDVITTNKPDIVLSIKAEFSYPLEKFSSVIPLPFNPPAPNLKNVEVRGLRISFKDEAVGEYSHIVDLGNKNLYHSLSLRKHPAKLSTNLLEDLLKLTSDLSTKILEQKK